MRKIKDYDDAVKALVENGYTINPYGDVSKLGYGLYSNMLSKLLKCEGLAVDVNPPFPDCCYDEICEKTKIYYAKIKGKKEKRKINKEQDSQCDGVTTFNGMTLLDFFRGCALTGILLYGERFHSSLDEVAERANMAAKAMMKIRGTGE